MKSIYKPFCLLICIISITFGCKNDPEKKAIVAPKIQKTEKIIIKNSSIEYAEGTTDEAIAGRIKHYLTTDYLKNDLEFMSKEDRKFQFQTVDLNNDGRQELFINFITSYFCGTGGCTLLLLDHDWKTITRFTVTSTPLMIEPNKQQKWSVLMVKDNGVWKELVNENGKYPSNPSLLSKSKMDAPSGHAQVIFSDEFSPANTFNF
ncbi:MAG TPA: hypothetical protein VLR29_02335 [Flavobacterium sp.]|nr:hypothetical protein [Flavobacterium sp.]